MDVEGRWVELNGITEVCQLDHWLGRHMFHHYVLWFEIKVCYPPAVQVVESFKNISEVESHLLLCQVAPAHNIVQETSLVCHLLNKYIAVGCLIRVQQPDQVGMIQSLQESDLLQHLLSTQQLLVDVFCRNGPFAPSLVTPLSH